MSLPPPEIHAGDSAVSTPAEDKKAHRKQLLAIRKAIPDDLRAQYNHALCEQLLAWITEKQVKTVSVYLPIRNEPDLAELYEALAGKVQMALPYVPAKDTPLQFMLWKPGDELVDGAFNIPVPKSMQQVPMPEALLIPCVGYTPERYRLGYGGGFFDRTLEGQSNVLTVGVAYSCLETQFEIGEYDVPLSVIVTESGEV